MSLDHAILGFLQYKPLSGYDLKTAFDMSVKHFWPADQSQIYRTLSRLSERGWADVEVIEQNDHPDKKVYHITDKGRDELMNWLTAPLPSGGGRIAKLIQIFFAGQLSDEEIKSLFQQMIQQCQNSLDGLLALPEQIKSHDEKEKPSPRDAFFWMLTLDYGILMTETCLSWLENVLARIERGEHLKGEFNENSCS